MGLLARFERLLVTSLFACQQSKRFPFSSSSLRPPSHRGAETMRIMRESNQPFGAGIHWCRGLGAVVQKQ